MKTGIYREMGWVAEVEILEDNSNSEWKRYKLKVIKTICDSDIVKSPVGGTEFVAEACRGFEIYVGWYLSIN
jgi:hypothetical protein